MILYERQGPGSARHILLFGSGLIGGAIAHALARAADWQRCDLLWDWADPDQRALRARAIEAALGRSERIDIVWSAGISGFASTKEAMDGETALVGEIVALAVRLRRRTTEVVLHHFSSLGALFEGQCWIGRGSSPKALREYGKGKLAQEALVLAAAGPIVPRIYRPSSVYGFVASGRRGLIPSMLAAVLGNRTMTVFGSPQTLRDYVYTQDVADFIVAEIEQRAASPDIVVLGHGKPTSLAEVIATAERQTERRLYLRYEHSPHNTLNMTVQPSAPPRHFRRTSLELGIHAVHNAMVKNLICRPQQAF